MITRFSDDLKNDQFRVLYPNMYQLYKLKTSPMVYLNLKTEVWKLKFEDLPQNDKLTLTLKNSYSLRGF